MPDSPSKRVVDGYDILKVLNRGGWGNGDVYLAQKDGRRLIIKAYADSPWIKRWMGDVLLRREKRAYHALQGVTGVPELVECNERKRFLVITHIDGERINHRITRDNRQQLLKNLNAVVERMHRRGIYHLDLRNSGNILVDRDNRVYLIDFASAVIFTGRGVLSRWLSRPFYWFDRYGHSKWVRILGNADSKVP